ncbi:hypothetical protein BDD43_4272 [Mucilaginibacter gracilis]|uniref:MoxR-vWA-beta-propeller ternary system domain-containing protein n=1 Tax=Mucilaginibacter gracilis TaxID=423350 RepID=A0A495J5P9_9SPHI|nr:hypothetical protein [Mucilaginibacter gracilis]RKR84051.1 hypothetical protein BDD43_4272 [Mucilaginibacter gracilis]
MEKIVVLEDKYADTLGNLRGITGLKAAAEGDLIWLRGIDAVNTDKRVLSLPVLNTYLLDTNGLLFPSGGQTPVAKLPVLDWQVLKTFLPVQLPVSALPGKVFLHVDVRLARSERTREAFALLTDLSTWKAYAETAPETRLRALRFAVSAQAEVLVLGKPLPQLPGRTFWADDRLLIPTGYDLDPPVLATMLKADLFQAEDNLALFTPDNTWQAIPLSAFQAARRSAVRLTQLDHD